MNKEEIQKRIDYLKDFLAKRPEEFYYMGDSDYAEDAVEQENRHNEQLAKEVEKKIKRLKLLLK